MPSEHSFGEITVSQAELETILKESAEEHALLVRECAERGHLHAEILSRCYFRGKLEIYMQCPDCDSIYKKAASFSDILCLQKSFNSIIY